MNETKIGWGHEVGEERQIGEMKGKTERIRTLIQFGV